jgi:hypothetical protein
METKAILKYIVSLLRFPGDTVRRHAVVADLLNMLAEQGFPVSSALAEAIVEGHDEAAIAILERYL